MTKKKEANTKPSKKKKITEKIKPQLIIKPENNSAKRLMWFSVSLFTAVILILWGWSMKISLSSLNFKKSAEGQLLQRSQAEWDRLFNDTQLAQEQSKRNQQIKDSLRQIITILTNSTTTSTIGISTSTSTTNPTYTSSTTSTKATGSQ